MMMASATEIEYPLLVGADEPPPPGVSPPYVGSNLTGSLEFFRDTASDEEWVMYHAWLQEVNDDRYYCSDELVATDSNPITITDAYTLRPGEWIVDSVLHYVPNSMKPILGLTDPSVHFFTSFFLTKLMQEGNADPKIAGIYCYVE